MLRTWSGAEQFCSARPVRAPPEGQCPAHGQVRSSFAVRAPCAHHRKASAPPMARCSAKKRAATGKENERKARIAKPFTVEGLALGSERQVRSTPLSRAISLPPAGERPCAKHIPFACHAPGRALFCGALAHVRSIGCASGARTGRALQNGCAPCHWQSHCPAFGCRAVAQAARHWQSVKPQAAQPLTKPMLRTCLAQRCFAVRAPCAHHWHSQCFAHAWRFVAH